MQITIWYANDMQMTSDNFRNSIEIEHTWERAGYGRCHWWRRQCSKCKLNTSQSSAVISQRRWVTVVQRMAKYSRSNKILLEPFLSYWWRLATTVESRLFNYFSNIMHQLQWWIRTTLMNPVFDWPHFEALYCWHFISIIDFWK